VKLKPDHGGNVDIDFLFSNSVIIVAIEEQLLPCVVDLCILLKGMI